MNSSAHGPGLSSSDHSRIVVLERPGCHLCEVASHTAHAVAREFGTTVQHKNIEESDELARRWSLEIPVIAVDGNLVAVYRVEPNQLRAALRQGSGPLSAIRRIFSRKRR